MTYDDKLTMLERMTDETEQGVLSTYLLLAEQVVISKAYPFDDVERPAVMPARYDGVQVEIAAYMLNKRGAEGQTQHSENGITRQYENADVPSSMLKAITPYCGVIK